MSWTRLDLQKDSPHVEVQLGEHWCGAACAAMLLRDRGIDVAQPMIAAGLRQPSEGAELARRLNECSSDRHTWIGGQLDLEPPLRVAHADFLARVGSWAAQLIRAGERDGHWVVVDGVIEQAVAVRDPDGSSYRIPWSEFADLVRFMVVVFEEGS